MLVKPARSFYRPAFDKTASIGDGCFANDPARVYGVIDCNAAAHSPSNSQHKYPGGLNGEQMVLEKTAGFLEALTAPADMDECLLEISRRIRFRHRMIGKDPVNGDDVGGASFAFCQLCGEGVKLFMGGDCPVLVKLQDRCLLYVGFNPAAFDLEAADQDAFNQYLRQTITPEKPEGSIGAAWDLYFPHYRSKRLRCKNKNIGSGGHPDLNGHPDVVRCRRLEFIGNEQGIQTILLMTDGFLPPKQFDGKNLDQLAETIWSVSAGDPNKILEWRDAQEAKDKRLKHVEKWPEAAMVRLDF